MIIWLKGPNENKKVLKFFTLKQFNKISIVSFWVIMLVILYLNEISGHFRFLSIWFEKFIP